jgi:UDP-N-acetylglucosamine transferase subunit ALG13
VIFVTVGSQLPFDRLITAVDAWAGKHQTETFFAQIGDSEYNPKHMGFCQTMTPIEYGIRLKEAKLVISHVGTGVIINALELGKPLLLMPRLLDKKEIRNNHQLTSVQYFSTFPSIHIIETEETLNEALTKILTASSLNNNEAITTISDNLIRVIREFVTA